MTDRTPSAAQGREPGEVDLSKTHKCPVCDKTFWTFFDIYDHMARRHRG